MNKVEYFYNSDDEGFKGPLYKKDNNVLYSLVYSDNGTKVLFRKGDINKLIKMNLTKITLLEFLNGVKRDDPNDIPYIAFISQMIKNEFYNEVLIEV